MEKNKDNKKKNSVLKMAGNLLTVLALVFVIRKLVQFDIDYALLANTEALLGILIISVIYGGLIVIYGWPWRNYVKMITHTELPYVSVAFVIAKSNLLKYIPGNVFQYIGRNELAVRRNLKHSEVGMATVFDVITNLLAAAILGGIFYFDGLTKVLEQFGNKIMILLIIGIFLITVIMILIWLNKRQVVLKYIVLLRSKDNIIVIIKNICFYAVNMLVNALLYILTLKYILSVDLGKNDGYILMGAFILSWIVGFIVPGAPGGIGIREFVITLLVPKNINVQIVLLGIVVYRLINIFGDILGFIFTGVVYRFCSDRERAESI